MKTLLTISILILTFLSCNNKQSKKVNIAKTTVIDSSYFCIQDSITVPFLSKANYKKAIATCRLTIADNELIVNGNGFMGPSRFLEDYFDKDKVKNIIIKHVFWETKDGEHMIQVWYEKKNNQWLPIKAYKHHKSDQF
ncbi:hypothetical protein [uncultured Olleya sp.]|uniref:hypothetical protein n=1 Tax=uncultured Olleya sp. TaxID=757243 RepID=UPI00259454E2|nr:hypothetical protein [uncultured Olleya sp.]